MKLSITTSCVFSCFLSAAILFKDQRVAAHPERAVTMWWVLFNKPSACITNPDGPVKCGIPDLMGNAQGGTNNPNIAIINASGGVSDSTGFLRLAAALYKTSSCALDLEADNGQYVWGGPPALYDGSSFGYCPADGEVTEVHIVMRDHGPVTADKLKQLTTFTDPSCSQAEAGGSNLCVDIGAVGFPPMSEDGLMTKDIGHFPKFPPGCAAAEEDPCPENVEMIQLMAGMGNEVTVVRTGDALQVVAEITVPAVQEDPIDYIPNPQQTDRTERPCLADCIMKEKCDEECEVVCTPLEPPAVGELCEEVCSPVCQLGEVCTFEVGRDELSSELGYFEFKGVNGDTCPGTNPVLGIKKGATYLFTQRRTGNYYHPLGFAYGADGALDEQPELEPGICPGTVKGEEATTECDCKETGLCPAPMYYTGNNYLGAYSNNPYLAPINGESDDFGLDAYEPQFFYPLLQWKGTPREEDPEGPGYYQVALHIPEEIEYTGDFFYFCHIHQFMTGRFKFVDEAGLSISPDNTLRIPYEYQEPDAYDRSCGATGIGESQLPDMECPTTFVCDAPDAAVAPFAAKFAECVDSMNCAMLKGITTKISSDSPIALFNHQMIPHHQQAVNMCKALDVAQGTECEDIFDEDEPKCVLKVLCQEIINVQNAQIQTMRGILQQLELPDTDNCIVDIPVDPQTACETQSEITGYTWCVLTQTCVPPGDDACLEAECEENSIVTGKHWCALTQTCFEQGDQSCDKAYCELDSEGTGYTWCELTGTCLAPGDDACLEATCEENSVSTGYHWCALTQICFPPGDRECDKAYCELESESTGFSWCDLLEKCLPPTVSPTLMPTRSSTSKSSKSSKSRRHTRQLKYE